MTTRRIAAATLLLATGYSLGRFGVRDRAADWADQHMRAGTWWHPRTGRQAVAGVLFAAINPRAARDTRQNNASHFGVSTR